MSNPKSLIFLAPLSQPFQDLKEAIGPHAKEDNIEIYVVDSLDEMLQLMATIGQCLVLASNARKCASMLQKCKPVNKKNENKILLLTKKTIPPKTLDKFIKAGLTDSIVEPVAAKTLQYKVKLFLRSIANTSTKGKFNRRLELESKEEKGPEQQKVEEKEKNLTAQLNELQAEHGKKADQNAPKTPEEQASQRMKEFLAENQSSSEKEENFDQGEKEGPAENKSDDYAPGERKLNPQIPDNNASSSYYKGSINNKAENEELDKENEVKKDISNFIDNYYKGGQDGVEQIESDMTGASNFQESFDNDFSRQERNEDEQLEDLMADTVRDNLENGPITGRSKELPLKSELMDSISSYLDEESEDYSTDNKRTNNTNKNQKNPNQYQKDNDLKPGESNRTKLQLEDDIQEALRAAEEEEQAKKRRSPPTKLDLEDAQDDDYLDKEDEFGLTQKQRSQIRLNLEEENNKTASTQEMNAKKPPKKTNKSLDLLDDELENMLNQIEQETQSNIHEGIPTDLDNMLENATLKNNAEERPKRKSKSSLSLENEDGFDQEEEDLSLPENIRNKKRSKLDIENDDEGEYLPNIDPDGSFNNATTQDENLEDDNTIGFTLNEKAENDLKGAAAIDEIDLSSGNKADNKSDNIKSHYSNQHSLHHNKNIWGNNFTPSGRGPEKEVPEIEEDVLKKLSKESGPAGSIDYSKFKKEFDAIQIGKAALDEESYHFEPGEHNGADLAKQMAQLNIDPSLLEEESVQDQEVEGALTLYPPESHGLEYLIKGLHIYQNYPNQNFFEHFSNFLKDELQINTSFYWTNPQTGAQELVHCGHQGDFLESEEWESYLLENWDLWNEVDSPTWYQSPIKDDHYDFVFPFYEGVKKLGFILASAKEELATEKNALFEAVLELSRGKMIQHFTPIRMNQTTKPPEKEKPKKKKMGFFSFFKRRAA